MDKLKKIVWLASYPKSGNTWFRAFLSALLHPGQPGIDINNLNDTTMASSRQLFDEMAGVPSADLTPAEIDRLRPLVYRRNALESDEIVYHKVHDCWKTLPDGTPLFPADITRAVLYFIRNPLDVAVSFSHHLPASIDHTIDIMSNPGYAFCQRTDLLYNQLRQQLHTWSGHVTSWVDHSRLPLLVLRYEDMKADPFTIFSKAVTFIGIKASSAAIKKAIEQTSFDRLKQQEAEKGFSEKSARADSFFRKGVVGDWKNVLTPEQTKRITSAHAEVMHRFGYLDEGV